MPLASQIPVPEALSAQAQEILNRARKIATTLDRFTTEAKLDEADALLAELRRLAGPMQFAVKSAKQAHRRQVREAEIINSRAEASNARILAERRMA